MPHSETPSYRLFASNIGLLSDVNGDLAHFKLVSETMWKRGVGKLIAVGPLGFSATELEQAAQHLRDRDQILYVREQVTDLPATRLHEGMQWFSDTIAVVPDGYRAVLRTWPSPVTLHVGAAPNGAAGISTEDDEPTVKPEGNEEPPPVQIVVGGDAAVDAHMSEAFAAEEPEPELSVRLLPPRLRELRPKLYVGTHPSRTIDHTATYSDDSGTFEMRTILLAGRDPSRLSQAILNVGASDAELLTGDQDTVTQLTGTESGIWVVRTQQSQYIFDLDHGTVARNPGQTANRTMHDTIRRLRAIETCEVGHSGYWTMKSDDPYPHLTDYYWAASTEIRDITRMSNPDV